MAGVKPLPFRQLRSECGAGTGVFVGNCRDIIVNPPQIGEGTESVCHFMRILAIETIEQSVERGGAGWRQFGDASEIRCQTTQCRNRCSSDRRFAVGRRLATGGYTVGGSGVRSRLFHRAARGRNHRQNVCLRGKGRHPRREYVGGNRLSIRTEQSIPVDSFGRFARSGIRRPIYLSIGR